LLVSANVHAGTKYWDINGAASGAGSTSPSGLWDTGLTTNWTTNSAGADATSPFTVSLSGAISVCDITVQEGTLTLTGGSLSVAANAVQWDGGAGLTINSAVLMNGKTLSTTGLITLAGPVTIDNKLSIIGGTTTLAGDNTGTGGVRLNTAGSSLLSSFGLTTSSAGAFTASYAFDVEDQALPGATDLPTQTINLSANVFNPANLVVNLSGPKVTIANQAGSYVAAGQFTSASLALTSSSGWSIVATGPLDLAADSSVRDIATFDSTHLLNGTHRNAITLVARNDHSLIGSAPGDVINRSYSLAKTVSGNAGLGIANAAHAALLGSADGGSYAGFGYASGNTGGAMNTVATILDGTPSTARIIEMYFMARTSAALIQQSYLYSDVLHLSGVGTDTYVLQMSYDPARVNGGDVKLGYRDSQGFWVNAVLGNIGGVAVNQGDAAYDPTTDFHLGYYGFDSRTNTVWAVLNHNSEFAVIPEPASFGLLAIVAVALIRRRRRVTSVAA
jgi:hypothetical protein